MIEGKRKTFLKSLAYMIALSLLLAACNAFFPAPQSGQPPQQGQPSQLFPSDPFVATAEGGDGIFVEFRGFSRGFHPGDEVAYNLDAHNGSGAAWQARYCLLLLDRAGVVANLAQEDFSLRPDEGFGAMIVVSLPAALEPGAYGLRLLIPGRLGMDNTIYLGEATPASAGPWPEVAGCP